MFLLHSWSRPLSPALNPSVWTAVSWLVAWSVQADVRLHPLFSDHAVLQRGKPIRIWGWGSPGEAVTVAFSGQAARTTTGSDGKWSTVLGPFPANASPATLSVQGQNALRVQDLLVGEVWLCSGQSNMEWPMSRSFEPEADIQAGSNSNLRLFTVVKNRSSVPLDTFAQPAVHTWKVSAPESVRSFTAVGYYFGRDLQAALGVPVGLIHTSWGGSPAEVWMSETALKSNHIYARDILDPWVKQLQTYRQNVAVWESEKAKAAQENQPFTKGRPGLGWTPAELYNAMLAPLIPYGIAGAIWYQGESNAGRAFEYRSLFADMIRNWRRDFGQGDFGFLAVQLAPWDKNKKRSLTEMTATPVESDWAELREAQSVAAKALPNVGIAVITDVGDKDDIHPTKKQPVGARLARLAERSRSSLRSVSQLPCPPGPTIATTLGPSPNSASSRSRSSATRPWKRSGTGHKEACDCQIQWIFLTPKRMGHREGQGRQRGDHLPTCGLELRLSGHARPKS